MARPGTAGRGVHRPYDANELRAAALVAPSCRTRRAETLGLLTVDSEVAVIGRRPASAAALRGSESLPALMHPPVSYTPQRSTTPTFARAGGRSSPQLMAPFWEPPPRPQTASVSAAEVALAQHQQRVSLRVRPTPPSEKGLLEVFGARALESRYSSKGSSEAGRSSPPTGHAGQPKPAAPKPPAPPQFSSFKVIEDMDLVEPWAVDDAPFEFPTSRPLSRASSKGGGKKKHKKEHVCDRLARTADRRPIWLQEASDGTAPDNAMTTSRSRANLLRAVYMDARTPHQMQMSSGRYMRF